MSESLSIEKTIVAPTLVGVWMHDPVIPDETISNFLHVEDRTETHAAIGTAYRVHGRSLPVAEFGEASSIGIDASVPIPFGDDHASGVQWFRDAVERRRVICYRDGRGRVVFGVLLGGAPIKDERAGSTVSLKLTAVNYSPVI